MIDLFYWPTPNGWKASIALEEMELEYELHHINIGRGEQFAPEFLAVSPNNRIPAIVDRDPEGGGEPISVFETGAILLYLADKTGRFIPGDIRGRNEVIQWLMWQMGGLGPMLGQNGHFKLYAPEKIPYAIDRYTREVLRLYGVMDRRLADRDYLAGDYSIADMACWPWIVTYKRQEMDLDAYPNLRSWYDRLKERPGLRRGFGLGRDLRRKVFEGPDDQARALLFGQGNADDKRA